MISSLADLFQLLLHARAVFLRDGQRSSGCAQQVLELDAALTLLLSILRRLQDIWAAL